MQNATVVICCISDGYFESQASRQEAQYAYILKKVIFVNVQENYEPTGWLGLLLGAELYYKMHNVALVSSEFANLVKNLRHEQLDVSRTNKKTVDTKMSLVTKISLNKR